MPDEASRGDLYRRFATKKPDDVKGKIIILAIILFSIALALFFYFTSKPAECGAADGVCPQDCDYSEDADCAKPTTTTTTTLPKKLDCDQECRYIGYEYGKCLIPSCDAYFISIGEVEGCKNCCCKMRPTTNQSALA